MPSSPFSGISSFLTSTIPKKSTLKYFSKIPIYVNTKYFEISLIFNFLLDILDSLKIHQWQISLLIKNNKESNDNFSSFLWILSFTLEFLFFVCYVAAPIDSSCYLK
jgi:hypothetical protein